MTDEEIDTVIAYAVLMSVPIYVAATALGHLNLFSAGKPTTLYEQIMERYLEYLDGQKSR